MGKKPKPHVKKKRGAPFKLTQELQEKICAGLRAGNYIQVVCEANHINPGTFYNWMERGKEKRGKEFIAFFNAARESIAYSEMKLVVSIDRHANGRAVQMDSQGRVIHEQVPSDWRAAAWLLERKFPDRWGKRDQMKIWEAQKGESFIPPGGAHAKLLDLIHEKEKNDELQEINEKEEPEEE